MGDTYGSITEEADKQWMLERARIMSSIQSEMSAEEMKLPEFRYWTDIDKKRWLQVISSNDKHYVEETPEETATILKELEESKETDTSDLRLPPNLTLLKSEPIGSEEVGLTKRKVGKLFEILHKVQSATDSTTSDEQKID